MFVAHEQSTSETLQQIANTTANGTAAARTSAHSAWFRAYLPLAMMVTVRMLGIDEQRRRATASSNKSLLVILSNLALKLAISIVFGRDDSRSCESRRCGKS
jgi:hypothetical protein